MRVLNLLLALFLITGNANGQISFGPEVGANVCTYSTKADGANNLSEINGGIRAGVKADIALAGHIHLQTGILYVENEFYPSATYVASLPVGSGPSSMKISTIDVPVLLTYKLKNGKVNTPLFSAGPYLGYNVGGTATISNGTTFPNKELTYTRKLDIGSSASDDIKSVDVGISANIGMQMANGLYLMVFFQKGFVNLLPQGNSENAIKNYNLGICLGYFFQHKRGGKTTEVKSNG